jgi:prepilin-type N-terminal cleavage/methylation domain-containing protein
MAPMRKSRGFTLIEVVVVLIIFGIVLTMAAAVTRGIAAGQKRSNTVTRMQTVDAAIAQFVAVQKRLPCPADGTKASNDASAGLEVRRDASLGCTTAVGAASPLSAIEVGGVVPWRTLGLSEQDATDGWDHRFTYRIDPTLAIDYRMDMSQCDPASNAPVAATATCATGCSSSNLGACTPPQSYLLNKGLAIRNVSGTVIMDPAAAPATGAAYVLISAGASGGGGYLNTGVLGAAVTTEGTEEQKNYANGGVAAYYVDDSISEVAGATHFDDLVSRPSVLTLINKAALGPRSHS